MAISTERVWNKTSVTQSAQKLLGYATKTWPLYVMFLPALLQLAFFHYYPMYGLVIAFQDYSPAFGFSKSPWVGFDNFRFMISSPDFALIVRNTFVIALGKLLSVQIFAILIALLLNEISCVSFKRTVQSLIYLPHFLSWVILAGILLDFLGSRGIVNQLLGGLGNARPILFLGSNKWFVPTILATNLWQRVGWATIIYLAALTAIDPQLHEAAAIDGASRWQRVLHVTLPGIRSTVILLACLNLGNVLQAGFEQILNLYNPAVYRTGDILDTYVFREGLMAARFSLATAIGLVKSAVGFALILVAYRLADKYAGYRVF